MEGLGKDLGPMRYGDGLWQYVTGLAVGAGVFETFENLGPLFTRTLMTQLLG
jgi:hypothetical protein